MLETYIERDQKGLELSLSFWLGLRSETQFWRAHPLAVFIFFQVGASDLDVVYPRLPPVIISVFCLVL